MIEKKTLGKYDIVVIGAGHAGCEAALAAARMGKNTLILSMNLESVANMFCNPSIGGTGKGHLVREIDALGGQMGLAIDESFIQSRMLNTSKGPAVQSLRAQADKNRYHQMMKKALEEQEGLMLKQGEVIDIDLDEAGKVKGVLLRTGAYYSCDAVILATGTFLGGKVFIGDCAYESGPSGLAASTLLGENLKKRGMKFRRFKTGTPARVLSQDIDYEKMTVQEGDEEITPFSFMNDSLTGNVRDCYLTYTNEETHRIIRENIHRSAMYSGQIEGVGPRYCPSIEDKISRFPERERHQVFVEPEGLSTDEMYLQGLSSSLPEDVQLSFYRSIPGLEKVRLVRSAYAIEYDCIDPQELSLGLQYKGFQGLFCAGQFNGSSGYEEAAAQGLMAGVNAVLWMNGREPFVLDRSEAYIGVLIDDLVTKGTNEPYRIMTSRAEYRLLLRQDNADTRLTEKGRALGLVSDARWEKYLLTRRQMEEEMKRLAETTFAPKEINPLLEELGSSAVDNRVSLLELIRRPELSYDALAPADPERKPLPSHVKTKIQVNIRYEGYIEKQLSQVERFKRLETVRIPEEIDYQQIRGLRLEAIQKLSRLRPLTLGQASRISGVSPADINVLLVYMEKMRRSRSNGA
ncbi:MAG: tRNA uridine-5-carboxymethylaminomethyl(34) synthesis enzyme MnmG [Firmicutes bacterium]|nr:tRNA uridine-5-carboxymethylaminomethyl(34) synthesis enzyme MnmG [Bacillota bacterium]